jgi:hypothetical protein
LINAYSDIKLLILKQATRKAEVWDVALRRFSERQVAGNEQTSSILMAGLGKRAFETLGSFTRKLSLVYKPNK